MLRRAEFTLRIASSGCFVAALLATAHASAQSLAPTQAHAPSVTVDDDRGPSPVRVALSDQADERLVESRLRRLLSLELKGVAELAKDANGPLGEDMVRVWIDVPSADRALIEVRRTDRSLARRALDIGGFPADLAARVVAIATSEMVRVQVRSVLRPKPVEPNHDGEGDEHGGERFAVAGLAHVMLLPSSDPLALYGPELSLQHRHSITAQTLYARWLVGVGDSLSRWFELGASIDVRLQLAPSWTLSLAGKAGGVALSLPDALRIGGRPSTTDWTVRAGGLVGIEARVAEGTALVFAVEPGASVRNLEVLSSDGSLRDVGGFTLGLSLGLVASPEARHEPAKP